MTSIATAGSAFSKDGGFKSVELSIVNGGVSIKVDQTEVATGTLTKELVSGWGDDLNKYSVGCLASGWGDKKTGPSYSIKNIKVASVPEPSAFGMLAGLGALALVASRRRRK